MNWDETYQFQSETAGNTQSNIQNTMAVKKLDLSNSTIGPRQIRYIFEQSQIEELHLSKCRLQCMSFNSKASEIFVLNLSHNQLDNTSVQRICTLPELLDLNLSQCCLYSIPQFLCNTHIAKLDVSGNKFAEQVAPLFLIKSLKELNISDCEIKNLGLTESVTFLTKLNISNNKIDEQSQIIICHLPQLQEVDMSSCSLREVPIFCEGSEIRKCNLSHNYFKLRSVSITTLFVLPLLGDLNISSCGLKIIDPFDPSHSKLQSLDVQDNALSISTMERICQISSIKYLNMMDCDLEVLPVFSPTSLIHELRLSGNGFQNTDNLSKIFILPHLEILGISCCYIKQILQFNPYASRLKVLDIGRNMLNADICSLIVHLPFLESLDMSFCSLNQLPLIPKNTNIKMLDISSNPYTDTSNLVSLFQLSQLETLILSNCYISSETQDFDVKQSNIKELQINNYQLYIVVYSVVQSICQLQRITDMTLCHCGLNYIPQFPKDSQIEKLNISNNRLDYSDISHIFALPSLVELVMSKCNLRKLRNVCNSHLKVLEICDNYLDIESVCQILGIESLDSLTIENDLRMQRSCFTRIQCVKFSDYFYQNVIKQLSFVKLDDKTNIDETDKIELDQMLRFGKRAVKNKIKVFQLHKVQFYVVRNKLVRQNQAGFATLVNLVENIKGQLEV